MDVIPPSFAYGAGVAQDVTVGRMDAVARNKRRRLDLSLQDDGSTTTDVSASLITDDYVRQPWSNTGSVLTDDTAPQPRYTTSQDGSSFSLAGTPVAGPRWQASNDPAADPDLASFQQQPYFHQPDRSVFNASWPPGPANGTTLSVTEPNDAKAFFTSTSSTATVPNDGALEVAPVQFQYPDIDATVTGPRYAYHPASLAQQDVAHAVVKPSMFYSDDASMHLKIQSLPILENLATQLIHTIAKASFPQVQELMKGGDSEDGQAYRTLKDLFDQTRKVYSRGTPFIDAIAIQMFQPDQQEIIRKANIATFISGILGAHDVDFFHLNEFFMETFVPLGHRLLKWQGAVYLELKTQTYISAVINSDASPEAMLDELFPLDLDAQILTRHPDAPSLSPSEQDFIDRSRARKSYLLAEPSSEDRSRELPKKYQWTDFIREFASCIAKNVESIMNVPVRVQAAITGQSATKGGGAQDSASALILSAAAGNGALTAAQTLALAGKGGGGGGSSGGAGRPSGTGDNTTTATPNITTAATMTAAATATARKPSQAASLMRQPWTRPEEQALLAGLAQVNGPHWSQILALYGRGGSVSEVLKDRNQVALKDKARNLKLAYLKTGRDVPPSLRGVTGELKKRGGARARATWGGAEDEGLGAGVGGGAVAESGDGGGGGGDGVAGRDPGRDPAGGSAQGKGKGAAGKKSGKKR